MPKNWLELARAEFRFSPKAQTAKTDTTPVSSVLSVTGNASAPLSIIQGSISFDRVSSANNPENQTDESQHDDFSERCGMIAANGHENSWVESAAALFTMPRPSVYSSSRWEQIVNDGGLFLDRWGRQAAEMGWRAVDVFGAHPNAPEYRLDHAGLVPMLRGRSVIDIAPDTARIDCGCEIIQTFTRSTMATDMVAVWQLGGKQK
jgi:hypothetical protein